MISKRFIVYAKLKAIADLGNPAVPIGAIETPEGTLAIPQGGEYPFAPETIEKLASFKESALICTNFEEFSNLVQRIAEALALRVAEDLPKIASVLNQYRLSANLPAL